jgi:hypothetical protein
MLDEAHADPIEYIGFHGVAATMVVEALHRAIAKAHADGDRPTMANAFARSARVMHAAGDHEAAALFSGAVARGVLTKLYAPPLPERANRREMLGCLRSKLGPEAYDGATRRGAAMAYDELVAFALHRLEIALAR